MSIFDLSKTPNSNTTIAGETAAEGMSPAGVNDVIRALAADLKKWQEDLGAALTTGGSATAMTLTTNSMVPALADGVQLGFVASHTNTGDVTLAVDGLVPKSIRGNGDIAIRAGNIVAGGHYTVTYDASAHAGAGAWILHGASNDLDIAGFTEEIVPAANDRVAFSDTNSTPAGLLRQTTWQNLLKVLGMLTVSTDVAVDDKVAFTDTSATPAGSARTATVLNFLKVVGILEELEAEDISPDFDTIPIFDYGAGKLKRTAPTSIGVGNRQVYFHIPDMRVVDSAAPESYKTEYSTQDIMVHGYAFADGEEDPETEEPTGTEKLQIRWAPPLSWDGGELKVKLRWVPRRLTSEDPPVSPGTTAGAVVWRVRAMCVGDGQDIPGSSWGTSETIMDVRQGAHDHHHTGQMVVTPSGGAPGKEVLIEVARLPGDDRDTMGGDAVLTVVEVVYVVTSNTAQ